jgi:hypothetical protein
VGSAGPPNNCRSLFRHYDLDLKPLIQFLQSSRAKTQVEEERTLVKGHKAAVGVFGHFFELQVNKIAVLFPFSVTRKEASTVSAKVAVLEPHVPLGLLHVLLPHDFHNRQLNGCRINPAVFERL